MDVLVVLPTYNERETLEPVVLGFLAQGAGVLVVDDTSPDGTGQLAEQLADRYGGVSVLHRPARMGLGRAYAAGFAAALARGVAVICEADADGSHDPAELPRLVAAIEAGGGLAIGSRYVKGGRTDGLGTARLLLSRAGNLYAKLALGLTVNDATSGYRAYRADVLAAIDSSSAESSGYAFQIEMVWRAHRAGAQVVEVPISFRERASGSSKLNAGIVAEALRLVTRLAMSRLRGPRRVPRPRTQRV